MKISESMQIKGKSVLKAKGGGGGVQPSPKITQGHQKNSEHTDLAV